MNSSAEIFYSARDLRTAQLGGDSGALSRPVSIYLGDDAVQGKPGQIVALALINMLSRVHRQIFISVSRVPLKAKSLVPADDLKSAIQKTALAINPFIELKFVSNAHLDPTSFGVSVGIGEGVPNNLTFYAGWNGGRATLSSYATKVGNSQEDAIGAATASCLAAAAIYQFAHNAKPTFPIHLNLVEKSEGSECGATTVSGPINVGKVQLLGAGAVAHGLLYWIREIEVIGDWDICDGDNAKIHNTNRCMGMTAEDAGWPLGVEMSQSGENKAKVAARMIGAKAHPSWYHESELPARSRPDLILPLANEYGLRSEIASMGMPVTLHATTSTNWTSELHRHLAGKDDCLGCRFPLENPQFFCSTGTVRLPPQESELLKSNFDEPSQDAALPFLSAAAGLMLAIALLELPLETKLVTKRPNHWKLHWELQSPIWQESIWPECNHIPTHDVRLQILETNPSRWSIYDSQSALERE